MSLFDQIIKENGIIINEGSAYISNGSGKNNFRLFADPSLKHKYGQKAYFKICNNSDYTKSTKVARICFYDSYYIEHDNDPDGKDEWFLSSGEISAFIKALTKTPNLSKTNKPTVWKELIFQFNERIKYSDPESIVPENLPIPDYHFLKYKRIKR